MGDVASGPLMNAELRDNLLATEVKAVTTVGDLVRGTGSHALGRLALGAAEQELGVVGAAVAWRTPFPAVPSLSWLASVTPAGGNNVNTNWNAAPGNPDLAGLRQWYGADSEPSGAQNDEASWYLLLGRGTWSFWLAYVAGPGMGIASCRLDGAQFATVDMYAAATAVNQTATATGIVVAVGGRHTLSLRMSSKHASSSGYAARVSRLSLARTA